MQKLFYRKHHRFKIYFSANEETDECNHQKQNSAVDSNSANHNLSEIVSPRNFNSILSRRLLSPDSALATSRDDDNGSSLSSASADEMGKLYEQVYLELWLKNMLQFCSQLIYAIESADNVTLL